MVKLPKHLGGHANTTHIDVGTLSFLKSKFQIQNMIDVGCGPGGMVDVANSIGIEAIGVDGDVNITHPSIIIHDFTQGKLQLERRFDLGWSVEFVEHVREEFIDNYMDVFSKCKYVCMTHAPSGKGGHHHVNTKSSNYWIDIFISRGFEYNTAITNQIRKISTMRREFMRNTGLFFQMGS